MNITTVRKPGTLFMAAALLTAGMVWGAGHDYERSFIPGNNFSDTAKKDTSKFTAFKDLPLKPTRRINYTTSEGTWISLDMSPDGSTIVFDLMGDIYTIPASGGKATVVTTG